MLAPLGVVLLSDNREIVALHYHYSAIQHLALPRGGLRASAVVALFEAPRPRVAGGGGAAGGTTVVTLRDAPGERVGAHVLARPARGTAHSEAVDRLLARVPPEAPVTVTTFVGADVQPAVVGGVPPRDRAGRRALVDLQRLPWPLDTGVRDEFVRGLMRGPWGRRGESGALLIHRRGDRAQRRGDPRAFRGGATRWRLWSRHFRLRRARPAAVDGGPGWWAPTRARRGAWCSGTGLRLMRGRYRASFRLRAVPEITPTSPSDRWTSSARGPAARVAGARARGTSRRRLARCRRRL